MKFYYFLIGYFALMIIWVIWAYGAYVRAVKDKNKEIYKEAYKEWQEALKDDHDDWTDLEIDTEFLKRLDDDTN